MANEIRRIVFEDYFTTQDVCECLDVSVMTVFKWRQKRDDPLPVVQIGYGLRAAIRFQPRELRDWLIRNQKVFTHKEIAKRLRCDESAAYRILYTDKLAPPYTEIGGVRLILKQHFRKWLEEFNQGRVAVPIEE